MDTAATAVTTQVWLAPSQAAGRFDPARQSPADAARWPTLRAPGRRCEWATSRALLAHLASQDLAHASLSHSRGWAAVLVAPGAAHAGVDLEWIRDRDALALARHAYAPAEVEALAALAGAERLRHFHLLWTLKESCAKALGLGLLAATHTCSFVAEDGAWQARLPCELPWRAWVYEPRPGALLGAFVAATGGALASAATAEWPEPAVAPWPLRLALGVA